MKCPYTITRKETTQTQMEYDDEGHQTFYCEIKNNEGIFVECEKENCGAWQNGKCCYAGN